MEVRGCPISEFDNLTQEELARPVSKIEEKWKLVPAFLQVKGLVNQHLDSFNHFLNSDIKKIVKANSKVTSDVDTAFDFEYTDVRVEQPCVQEDLAINRALTPHECRLRDLTYSAPIKVDVRFKDGKRTVYKRDLEIGKMPIMLKSSHCILNNCVDEEDFARYNECPLDPGGYFIVNGQEKFIIIHEQLGKNRMFVDREKNNSLSCVVISITTKVKSKTVVLQRSGQFFLQMNALRTYIPICVVFKAMDICSDLAIMQMIGTEGDAMTAFAKSLEECINLEIFTQKQALEYIGKRLKPKMHYHESMQKLTPEQQARYIMTCTLLSHVPVEDFDFTLKAIHLAAMVKRLIIAQTDPNLIFDRDFYGNKRLELAGYQIGVLFEDIFKQFNNELKKKADIIMRKQNKDRRKFDPVSYIQNSQTFISSTLVYCLSSGNWTIKRFNFCRQGVTQILSRLSYISVLGCLTRVKHLYEQTRKISGARSLHSSTWGMICPSDTPDGEQCGLSKHLSLMTHITTDVDTDTINTFLFDCGVEDITAFSGAELSDPGVYHVMVNGTIIGLTSYRKKVMKTFRLARRRGRINPFISISFMKNERCIYINSECGRICRPYIIVENGQSVVTNDHLRLLDRGLMDFKDFLNTGLIEFLDVNEENNCLVALHEEDIEKETTHLEIDPSTILGVSAGVIPYPHHNQSPRVTYQCSMGKQSMGIIGYNQRNRVDALLYNLVYPHKPLVQTRTSKILSMQDLPAGHNAVIAVMSLSGYDIEDAILLNKASIDRGFGRCILYHTKQASLIKYYNLTEDILKGPKMEIDEYGEKRVLPRYSKLERDGIIGVGRRVKPNTMLMNRSIPLNTCSLDQPCEDMSLVKYKDIPTTSRLKYPNYAEKVIMYADGRDNRSFKVVLRETRAPEVGDKFSSRHGQKGVVGLLVNQEDMPFSDSGITPDLIINPHGFPSRMTVGMLLEVLGGKTASLNCKYSDGTAFGGTTVEEMMAELANHGFNYKGEDMLYSGETGEVLSAYIFEGPVYYQKLKHMVADKIHARAKGPREALTRQPTAGRSRDGGLRVGEMERDCLISHGGSMLLMDRLLHASDEYEINVCRKCGMIVCNTWCHHCKTSTKIYTAKVPYAFKLLIQELIGMHIMPKLQFDKLIN